MSMLPTETTRVRVEVSLRSGNVAARNGSDGLSSHSAMMSDIITESGASGMIRFAASVLKPEIQNASQITTCRPASPRQMTVPSWGRC